MNILLATDCSRFSNQALEYLRDFPFPEKSRCHLITVLDKRAFKARKKSDLSDEEKDRLKATKKEILTEAEAFLDEQAQVLRDKGRDVQTRVSTGHPAGEIVKAAKELNADLIIVGSHGWTAAKRFMLGSVSDRVLQYAPCSVLIVKQPDADTSIYSDQVLNILLAYDDSESAKQAVEFMADLPLGEKTRVKALSVLPVIHMFRQDINQRLSWVWREKKRLDQQALERIAHEGRWGRPQVTTELLEAEDVSQTILDTAQQERSDLIVTGHKGKNAIDRFLLGSVTGHIAHHATCSVLAVRPKQT